MIVPVDGNKGGGSLESNLTFSFGGRVFFQFLLQSLDSIFQFFVRWQNPVLPLLAVRSGDLTVHII
jgi:hypothetical protein